MNIDEKIAIVKEVGEEFIGEEELRELFNEQEKTGRDIIAYDGFEPSGQMHIAQGLLKAANVNRLASVGITYTMFVADWHGKINNKMGGDIDKIREVGKYFIEIWKSVGMNLDKVNFVWSSDLVKNPDYWGTLLQLSTNATVSRVLKCGQIMGREDNVSNPASQILYPLMQATDIIYLKADIAQLGLDQRKVNMLARDIFPKMGFRKPVCLHHHMLLSLSKIETDLEGIDRKIAMKMSKSKPDTAIFMTDSSEDILRKFKKAHSVDGQVENNPVLDYVQHIIFPLKKCIKIERPEKYGGNVTYTSYEKLEDDFKSLNLKSLDLKNATAREIDSMLEPVRKHFSQDKYAKSLLEKIQSYNVTR